MYVLDTMVILIRLGKFILYMYLVDQEKHFSKGWFELD